MIVFRADEELAELLSRERQRILTLTGGVDVTITALCRGLLKTALAKRADHAAETLFRRK